MGITLDDYVHAIRRGLGSTLLRVLEPQTGSWANQNFWGDQRFSPFPVAANQIVQVLSKNSQFYGPPAVHSVQLGRSDDTPAGNGDVYASVTYGCGGVQNSFECDWLHGAQFALVCNSMTVNARTYAPGLGAYNAASASVALIAMVAKGSTNQGRTPLTFTEQKVIVAGAGGSIDFSVRDFAREAILHVGGNSNPSVPTNFLISFFTLGGSTLASYDAQVCAGGRSVPIPGGTSVVRIENLNALAQDVALQWVLGL